jgi:hypothetical protein
VCGTFLHRVGLVLDLLSIDANRQGKPQNQAATDEWKFAHT